MNIRPSVIVAALTCALTCASANAQSAPPTEPVIGYVKTAQGEATVIQQGRRLSARVGLPVTVGAVLATGDAASMGVTFKDDSIVSLGAGAELKVDDYAFDPMAGSYLMKATFKAGALYYVPGTIAKSDPEAVQISTPEGTMHVRGARLLARTGRADVQEAAR